MTWTAHLPATHTPDNTDELEARIALTCAGLSGHPDVGSLIQQSGGAAELLDAVRAGALEHRSVPGSHTIAQQLRTLTVTSVDRVLAETNQTGWRVLSPAHPDWPAGLRELGIGAPLLLWVRGNLATLSDGTTAIAGSRQPSRPARLATLEVATSLADRGWVVATGTAPGVDLLARKAALAMRGRALTISPSASAEHDLHTETSRGAVVASAAEPGAILSAHRVGLARRLLAALSSRTIAIDAESSIEARLAAETATALNRPVGHVSTD